MTEVALSENPSLAALRREFGDNGDLVLRAMLNVFIIDLITFFNVGKQMNTAQVAGTSGMLAEKYYFLKPDDFKLCFTNAKSGLYTALFDRIDGQIICIWLNEYCNERAQFFERKSMDEAKLQKIDEKNIGSEKPPEIKHNWKALIENINGEAKKEKDYEQFKQEYNGRKE